MKRTKKFVAAEKIALKIGVKPDDNIYKNLEQNNYFWDSDLGKWLLGDEPNPPTRLIEIRVLTDREKVENDCDYIIGLLYPHFILEKQSKLYPCRPPQQNKANVYLTFFKPKCTNRLH